MTSSTMSQKKVYWKVFLLQVITFVFTIASIVINAVVVDDDDDNYDDADDVDVIINTMILFLL